MSPRLLMSALALTGLGINPPAWASEAASETSAMTGARISSVPEWTVSPNITARRWVASPESVESVAATTTSAVGRAASTPGVTAPAWAATPSTAAPSITAQRWAVGAATPDLAAPDTSVPTSSTQNVTPPHWTAAPRTAAPSINAQRWSTAPGSAAPSTTAPGTSTPSTIAPGFYAPSTSTPGATPNTTAPGSAAPSTTAPGSAAPSTTAPGSAAPSTSAPGSAAPSTTAPGSAAPSTTAPGSAAPSTTAPGPRPADAKPTVRHRVTATEAPRHLIANGKGRATLFLNESTGATAASLTLLELQPGGEVPEHTHESSAEILYIEDGAADMTVSGQTLRVSKGDAVYIPAGAKHSARVVSPGVPFKAVQVYAGPGPEQRFMQGPRESAPHGR
nr:cupin domain-containing protein [Myxococcus sp. MH1]